jgi:hypothetical protein
MQPQMCPHGRGECIHANNGRCNYGYTRLDECGVEV